MNKQLHAGYILKTVKDQLENVKSDISTKDLLTSLSSFELNYNFDTTKLKSINDPIFTVLDNLISRGLPTISSLFIEESITKSLNVAEKKIHKKTKEIYFKTTKNINSNQINSIIDSLCIVDPRLKDYKVTSDDYNSWEGR